jgi:hypothetical protein
MAGRPKPFVLIDNDTVFLGASGKERFEDGVDTVPLVLFYAPMDDDSLHQITITLDGLKAVTDPFPLNAGGLHHMKIERQERIASPVGDTLIVRTTDDLLQLVSIGYDIYETASVKRIQTGVPTRYCIRLPEPHRTLIRSSIISPVLKTTNMEYHCEVFHAANNFDERFYQTSWPCDKTHLSNH